MKTCPICQGEHKRSKLTCSPECAAKYQKKIVNARRYTVTPDTATKDVIMRNMFLKRALP